MTVLDLTLPPAHRVIDSGTNGTGWQCLPHLQLLGGLRWRMWVLHLLSPMVPPEMESTPVLTVASQGQVKAGSQVSMWLPHPWLLTLEEVGPHLDAHT